MKPDIKKISLLSLTLTFILTGCGGGSSSNSDDSDGIAGPGKPLTFSKRVEFSTADQGLFEPGKQVKTTVFPALTLHQESIGPETKGEIYENVSQEVPLSTLQSAWDQAIATCRTTRSVKPVNYCESYSYTPTEAQCISGSATLPSSVTINCCTYLGVIDTDVTYPGCAGGILDGKKDYSTTIPDNLRTVNLGAGIGERPTQPAPRPFDVGLITRYQTHIDAGLELSIRSDGGSVDVGYTSDVSFKVDKSQLNEGEVFTLSAIHTPVTDADKTFIKSRYPNIDFAFQYYVDVLAKLDAEYAMMNAQGVQQRQNETIIDYATANLPDADPEGRLVGEIIGVNIGLTGLELRVFDNQPESFPVDFPGGVVFDFPLSFSWDVTTPFTCPVAGIPKLGTYLCGPPPPISTDLVELNIRTPALDTPASDDFEAGVDDYASLTPLIPLRNMIAADGSITSTTPSGYREILSAPFIGQLESLDDLLLSDGRLSTDWLRMDIDLDGLLSMYQGGVNPLGGNFSFGGETIDPKTGKNKSVADMEWNMVDFDFANWFHVDQTISFVPNLELTLSFSVPVQVRLAGESEFTPMSQVSLAISTEDWSSLEVIQPEEGVTVTSSYSLANNLFINKTDMLWTAALQESMLQVKVQGLLADLMADALLPIGNDLNFAVAQTTFSAPPVVLGSIADTEFTLDGFTTLAGDVFSTKLPD